MATGDKKTVVMQADRAIPNGVATLDESGVLDSLQWPDIDNFGAADRVLSNLTDPALALSNIGAASNPNLLDNWYFADPIDQRGGYVVPPDTPYYSDTALTTQVGTVTAYTKATNINGVYGTVTVSSTTYYVDWTAAVRGYVGTGYGIDRWFAAGDATGGVKPEDDGVTIYGESQYVDWRQKIESYTELCGKNVCLSALTADGTLWVQTGKIPDELSSTVTSIFSKYDDEGSGIWLRGGANEMFVQLRAGAGKSVTFIATKLELGSVQTLAHQDADGNWVLNDPPPDKHLELLKCCMSTADSSDTYANNKLTPAAINAVKKAGDTMTGNLRLQGSKSYTEAGWSTSALNMVDVNNQRHGWLGVISDGAGNVQFRVANDLGGIMLSPSNGVVQIASNGAQTILHTGNKPSGFYTGNGDATARTIETGGIGSAILIRSTNGSAFVVNGAGWSISNGQIAIVVYATANFNNGVLTLATNHAALNASGVTYYYQVL